MREGANFGTYQKYPNNIKGSQNLSVNKVSSHKSNENFYKKIGKNNSI